MQRGKRYRHASPSRPPIPARVWCAHSSRCPAQAIARAVKDIYDKEIRAECVDDQGNTNPEWSLNSIVRHLLHCNKGVFESYTEQVLQHLIVRQSQSIVDSDGRVDGIERKALLQSIDAYNKWKARVGVSARKRPATDMS